MIKSQSVIFYSKFIKQAISYWTLYVNINTLFYNLFLTSINFKMAVSRISFSQVYNQPYSKLYRKWGI